MSTLNTGDTGLDKEILDGFIIESLESLASLDALFIQLEKNPEDIDVIHPIFRAMHSLKGNAPFFGLMKIKQLAHTLESVLVDLREKKFKAHKVLINQILKGIDFIRVILVRVQDGKPEVDAEDSVQLYLSELSTATQLKVDLVPTIPTEEIPTPSLKLTGPSVTAHEPQKTMRVTEEKIDTFLSFVGELIILREMLRHFQVKIQNVSTDHSLVKDLQQMNDLFSVLSTNLEQAIMSIRKVNVKPLLQRVPRIVRDIAVAKKKEIEVTIHGEETEVDKSLVEMLESPLMHMVRNASDHGIELPAERLKAGKNQVGNVAVSIIEEKSEIVLTVEDDGAGLNFERLQQKAESMGLIKKGQALGKKELIELLFLPGVSTAQEVSDISGRGVGMDVVKRAIEDAGGKIDVESVSGSGSIFTIRIPKSISTQIIQGYIVTIDSSAFVFPLESVHESWSVHKSEVGMILDKNGYISRHNEIMPFYSLASLLDMESATPESSDELLIVTLSNQGKKLAFAVDTIVGVRQLVLKELDSFMINTSGFFLGGAFLGDGGIAFVLDTQKILELYSAKHAVQYVTN